MGICLKRGLQPHRYCSACGGEIKIQDPWTFEHCGTIRYLCEDCAHKLSSDAICYMMTGILPPHVKIEHIDSLSYCNLCGDETTGQDVWLYEEVIDDIYVHQQRFCQDCIQAVRTAILTEMSAASEFNLWTSSRSEMA